MFRWSFAPLLLSLVLHAGAAEPEVYTVKTLPAQMRYDVTELEIKPGAEVKIVFINQDQMPHNMVFFQPGTDPVAVCNQQMEKPDEALKRNWLPEDPAIWMHSKLLNPGEKEEMVFKAPDKLGVYPFACSMPGHAMIMQGRLKVFAPGPQLADLKFQTYLGDWKKLPDFSTLQVHREGSVPDNLVQLKFDDYKNLYGVVFTGKLKTPTAGQYDFLITSDDGSRVLIDGKEVVKFDGVHPANDLHEGHVKLSAGEHEFRMEYFQEGGGADIFVAWKGPDFSMTPLSKWLPPNWQDGPKKGKGKDENTGMPLLVEKEPVLYRNFIEGAGERGIGVGYPGHLNIAWNAGTMNLALAWRGAFIDAARHWNGRGGGYQPPLGYDVFHPGGLDAVPFAVLATPEAEWPKVPKGERPEAYQWKGYTLDAQRFPTFFYEWAGVKVADRFDVLGDGVKGDGKIVRTLTLSGQPPAGASFCAATGQRVQPVGSAFLVVSGAGMLVQVEGGKASGQHVVAPVSQEIKVTYAWPLLNTARVQAP